MSDAAYVNETSLLHRPLETFIATIQAIIDLEKFVADQQDFLMNVEEMFTAEAGRTFSSEPEEQHRKAATLVHSAMHRISRETKAAEESGMKDAESIRPLVLEQLRADMLSLTGNPEHYGKYAVVWNRVQARPSNAQIINKSLLISAVSDFEVLVSNIVRAQLSLRPAILSSDEGKYSFSEVASFASLEEFRAHCAERFSEGLMRGGLDEWLSWFGKRHKLLIPGVTNRHEDLVEIFQRRHLLVHNGGIVNRYYLTKVQKSDQEELIGKPLGVSARYLLKSLDALTAAGIKLVFGVWRSLSDASNFSSIDHRIVAHQSYDLLKSERFAVVEQINPWFIENSLSQDNALLAKVNLWIARKRLNGLDSILDEVNAWQVSSLAARYRLAKYALLEQNEEAYSLAKQLILVEEMSIRDWQEWPLLEELRSFELTLDSQPIASDAQPVGDDHSENP